MSKISHRFIVLAEIGNENKMECHVTEVSQSTSLSEVLEWVKSRDNHLEDDLRGKWTYARIYSLGVDPSKSIDDRQHIITINARRKRIKQSY